MTQTEGFDPKRHCQEHSVDGELVLKTLFCGETGNTYCTGELEDHSSHSKKDLDVNKAYKLLKDYSGAKKAEADARRTSSHQGSRDYGKGEDEGSSEVLVDKEELVDIFALRRGEEAQHKEKIAAGLESVEKESILPNKIGAARRHLQLETKEYENQLAELGNSLANISAKYKSAEVARRLALKRSLDIEEDKYNAEQKDAQAQSKFYENKLAELDRYAKKKANSAYEIFELYRGYLAEINRLAPESPVAQGAPAKELSEESKAVLHEAVSYINPLKPSTIRHCVECVDAILLNKNKAESLFTSHPTLVVADSYSSYLIVYDVLERTSQRLHLLEGGESCVVPYQADVLPVHDCVYITGGTKDTKEYLKTTYKYVNIRKRMELSSDLKVGRSQHTTVLINTRIICAGGRNANGQLKDCETLSVAPLEEQTWTKWPALNEEKSFPGLCAFAEPPLTEPEPEAGRKYTLYCFGGQAKAVVIQSIEFFILGESKGWTKLEVPADVVLKSGMGAVQIDDKQIWLLGGSSKKNDGSIDVYSFTVDSKKSEKHDLRLPYALDFATRKPIVYMPYNGQGLNLAFNGNSEVLDLPIANAKKEKPWTQLADELLSFSL